MVKRYIIYIVILLVFKVSFAQKEATHWYFGQNAGLDFSSGNPVMDSKGSLNTLEGCASISDSNGMLLFYTNGTIVWNRNHQIMPTGNTLFGNSTSTQSAIIVPKPGDVNIYYVFTVDWGGGSHGLNYYTVDMTLDKGLGDIIGFNGKPIGVNLISSPTSEKITAIKVFDEEAFWVISLKEDKFYVFKVSDFGVTNIPVSGNNGFQILGDPRGYLKTSPDGTKLISANMRSGTYLYDFDDRTGKITNERLLDVENKFSYGVEFSPLSKKLYLSTGNFDPDGEPQEENLYQFNLNIPDLTSDKLNATRVKLHTYFNIRAALQVGLDGKIYRAIDNKPYLGVINNPEADGLSANYVHNGISLGNRLSSQGLPPFIQSFFIANILVNNQCFGDETSFEILSNEPILAIVWDFGDGTTKSTEKNPIHRYSKAGIYTVMVEVTTASEVKLIEQIVSIFNTPDIVSPVILQQCDDDTDGFTNFNLEQSELLINQDIQTTIYSYYLSMEEALQNRNPIADPQNFSNKNASKVYVRVENQLNCYRIAELSLIVSTTTIPSEFNLRIDECDNKLHDDDDKNGITSFDFSDATQQILELFPSDQQLIVSYYENMDNALALQNEIDSSNFRNENSPFSQQIVVRVDNEKNNACVGLGYHITLNVIELPEFELHNDQFLCLNKLPNPLTIQVDQAQGNYIYEWRNENGDLLVTNTTSILEITLSGNYYIKAITDDGCSRTKKITIKESETATVESLDIVDVTENNTATIHILGKGDYEFVLDNINGSYQDENFFEGIPGGIHTIYINDKNGCGITAHEFVILDIPKFFTPNADGINDTWQVLGVFSQPNSKIYIFDKFGKLLKQIVTEGEGWDGIYRNKQMPSADYWYVAQLEDGRVFKGHFSLIRR